MLMTLALSWVPVLLARRQRKTGPTMGGLKGKTLFITGASRGIGLSIALRAAADGANVAVVAKTDQPHPKLPGTIHETVRMIEASGGKAVAVKTDIRDEEQVRKAVTATVEAF